MRLLDTLTQEEQDLLLWVAESETGFAEPLGVTLANSPSFDWIDAAADRLVQRGLLGREPAWLVQEQARRQGLCAYLTDQGAYVVAALWRRCPEQAPKAWKVHPKGMFSM
jgi:hypothetical protein